MSYRKGKWMIDQTRAEFAHLRLQDIFQQGTIVDMFDHITISIRSF